MKRDADFSGEMLTLLAARMVVLELCEIVDILVDDDPQAVGLVVAGDVGGRERF